MAFRSARMRSMRHMQTEPFDWRDVDVPGPDVTKRENLLQLANMTYNSYYEVGHKDWYDLGSGWNASHPFGWEPDADGLRGHVFVSQDESTVVISVKGTSAGWITGRGGPTAGKDKLNDNLLFSCCCARVRPTWSTVCDCYSGGSRCDQTCVEQALTEDSLYYAIGINLYNNVTYMYPNANIWVTGSSNNARNAHYRCPFVSRPLFGWRASVTRRCYIRSPCSGIRVPRRKAGCCSSPSTFSSVNPACYPCVPQRRSNPNGYLYWCDFELRRSRLCFGITMPPRKSHPLRYRHEARLECQRRQPCDQSRHREPLAR